MKHACVLDLRYAHGDDESAAALRAALGGPSGGVRPVVYFDQSCHRLPGLSDAITSDAPVKFITLGVAGSRPAPRIAVKTDATTDARLMMPWNMGLR